MARYGKREHGTGQVFRDKARGRWRGQVTIDGKRRSVSGATEGEARRKLDALLAGAASAADDDENPTLGAWLAYWVDELADTASENNRYNRQWAAAKLSALHGRRMDALRSDHVEHVLRGYAAKGMAKSSIVRMRTVGGMAFDTYNGRNGRTFNPFRRAVIGTTVPRAEKQSLTPEQATALLEVAEATPRYGIMVTLGLWLGMRPGEVAGLTWDAVNLNTAELSVTQMRRRNPDHTLTMAGPKSKSYRTLALPAPLADALRRHKAAQVREGLWAHKGLVVCTTHGAPLDPSNARREVRKMAEAAGIFFALTPNELRHTAATLLVEAGVPLVTVADMLGHKDVRMLANHYRHKVARVVDTSAAMSAMIGTAS